MKSVNSIPLFLIICSLFSTSCNQSNNSKSTVIKKYYQDGSLESESQLVEGKKNGQQINYYQDGTVRSILHYKDDKANGQQCFFYENGSLEQKVEEKAGIGNGHAYFFYKDGAIQSLRYYSNGKEINYGVDFWDDTFSVIKSKLFFNDSGQIYHKKNYDSLGGFLSEEGHN